MERGREREIPVVNETWNIVAGNTLNGAKQADNMMLINTQFD